MAADSLCQPDHHTDTPPPPTDNPASPVDPVGPAQLTEMPITGKKPAAQRVALNDFVAVILGGKNDIVEYII